MFMIYLVFLQLIERVSVFYALVLPNLNVLQNINNANSNADFSNKLTAFRIIFCVEYGVNK